MENNISFFLGTNTGGGFCSLFDSLTRYDGVWRTYVLKGGPGTGKSCILKRLAQKAEDCGCAFESIVCTSDTQSLDAVYIPERHAAVCDGTAPHVVEPKLPGVSEQLIDLGAFWDRRAIRAGALRIRELTRENRFCQKKTAGLLGAAKKIKEDAFAFAEKHIDPEKAEAFAEELCQKIPDRLLALRGNTEPRFLSGITPDGFVTLSDSVRALASDITVFVDESGFASAFFLKRLAEKALRGGYDVILCRDVLLTGEPAHLIIPELSLAFVTENADCKFKFPSARQVSASRLVPREVLAEYKENTEFDSLLVSALFGRCAKALRRAKTIHDELESCYSPHMDFQKADALAEELIREIFGGV